jgi:hypothetical protein
MASLGDPVPPEGHEGLVEGGKTKEKKINNKVNNEDKMCSNCSYRRTLIGPLYIKQILCVIRDKTIWGLLGQTM